MIQEIKVPRRHCYAVEFSPFLSYRIACVACEYYGLAGEGNLLLLDVRESGITTTKVFSWQYSVFDVSWSETNVDVVVTANSDGSICIWNVNKDEVPVFMWREHSKEVYGVDWCQTVDPNLLLSASWDGTAKLWDIHHRTSVNTFTGHNSMVYSVVWSPLVPKCFSATSGDGRVSVWDCRISHTSQINIIAHQSEVLSADWCKYNPNILASCCTDGTTKVWDLRNIHQPVCDLIGHRYAVRRVKFSPFTMYDLATCSYDFTVRLWNFSGQATQLQCIEHHTEFVYGIDYNLHLPGQMVDCSWDQTVKVYTTRHL